MKREYDLVVRCGGRLLYYRSRGVITQDATASRIADAEALEAFAEDLMQETRVLNADVAA